MNGTVVVVVVGLVYVPSLLLSSPLSHPVHFTANQPQVVAEEDVRQLEGWLFSEQEKLADVYAVGFQEIVDLNAVNVAMDGQSAKRAQAWQDRLTAALNGNKGRERYVLVGEKHLVGILLLVFVKELHLGRVREVAGATVGVGFGGLAGNKGSAAIRFKFYDSYFCFGA